MLMSTHSFPTSRYVLSLLLVAAAMSLFGASPSTLSAADRPNILWITSEDNGPQLGCYGDAYAVTPNLDAFAKKGCRYLKCWSNAPVCAPARTTIITGMYPPSLGAEHMRSMVKLPEKIKCYPEYLKAAGYHCTNNSKTDYNVETPANLWDESSGKAHWKNCPEGKPFFAIFNDTISHESQIRNKINEKDQIHDPAKVRIPAYHPDTPEVRKDWAQYYDRMTMMDANCGKRLQELEESGKAEDTIVFYYGDHGSGMPRSKRMPYNSGLHVPLIVYIPEKWKHLAPDDYVAGGTTDRLVSFVDLAPTLLSLAGTDIPEHLQGHAFLGPKTTEKQPYLYGFRGRMDERPDMIRSITDGRYVYIRNYMPHRPCGQHVDYMFQTPTTRVWKEMFDKGQLNEAQSHFWREKPPEELYDLTTDPDEVMNLADSAEHQEIKGKLAKGCAIPGDTGFFPEAIVNEWNVKTAPYDKMQDLAAFGDVAYVTGVAQQVTASRSLDLLPELKVHLSANNDYWAAIGVLMRGAPAVEQLRPELRKTATSKGLPSAIVAAEALARFGNEEDLKLALPILVEYANVQKHGVFNAISAWNSLDYLGEKARSAKADIEALPVQDKSVNGRMGSYCDRLKEKVLSNLK
ncbi:MAG: sulfatase [Planctomycetaceae bacterium]